MSGSGPSVTGHWLAYAAQELVAVSRGLDAIAAAKDAAAPDLRAMAAALEDTLLRAAEAVAIARGRVEP